MESRFSKEIPGPPPPTVYEQIGPEISHLLKKDSSVRHPSGQGQKKSPWIATLAICVLCGLYFMDPFLYAIHKTDALRTYLYLHNHENEASSTQALVATHILTPNEILVLNNQEGAYQDYFSSSQEADHKVASIARYMHNLQALHSGDYDQLGPIGKLRYLLFVRNGLVPPTTWSGLNPSVD